MCVSTAGCRALPELDWNPLVRIEHTADGGVEIEALGPIIDIRDGPEGLSHALRPLYQHKANFGLSVTDFLAPFGRHFVTRSGSRWRFWPLIYSGETRNSPVGEEWDGLFFPFIFAGNGPRDGDGYFAFWPLGGRIKNLFGIDTYDFFLWPFFSRTQMDITEHSDSWTVFLLGGWTSGGPRDGSWRFLPFYRHRLDRAPDGTLRTDQHTVLWPFFTWGLDHADTSDPSQRIAIWPLYSHEGADSWYRNTVLWPFFRFNRETDPPVNEGGDFYYDLPWPFFHWSRERKSDEWAFRVWPLYLRTVTPEIDSTVYMWPLVWWRKTHGRTQDEGYPPRSFERSDLHVIPFWHNSTRTVAERPGEDTQWQLWPLFHSDATAEGRRDMAFPSLVPVRHFEFMRPVEELYGPFWTLWRYRSDGADQQETRLLLDMLLWRHETGGLRVSIPFLYAQRPLPDGGTARQVLWGLLGWRNDAAGLSAVSLLGLDLWAR
ncbi:MAG: hypothetical protein H6825_03975 [Planctomycetes bacterium]|nr:hypothetical protein [Planctomycetota bacterium]